MWWVAAGLVIVCLWACGEVLLVDTDRACHDRDGDGHLAGCAEGTDCDDFNASVPGPELCNAYDDDCDGQVDEGFALLGEACAIGECGGRWGCRDKQVVCVADRRDVCNGLDDDCDGNVDEAGRIGFQSCVSEATGRCTPGSLTCLDGRYQCAPDIAPAELDELCNGLDDDCDGIIDEAVEAPSCYPGPEGTAGVGLCRSGVRRCELGRHRTCVGAVTPDAERCDGLDEDCDGAIDEGLDCACAAGEVRDCPPRPPALADRSVCLAGTQVCIDGEWGPCEGRVDPRPETCDGRDEDCDGAIDEGAATVGAPCEAGWGECRAAGLTVCIDGRLMCDAVLGEASGERCDALDHDCDGASAPAQVGQPCGEAEDGIWGCGEYGEATCFVLGPESP